MLSDLKALRSALTALPVAMDTAFFRTIGNGRLRHTGEAGIPDLIDEMSATLVCSALRTRDAPAVLVVFPDAIERRAPILFSTALIMDAVIQIEAGTHGHHVLYLSTDSSIRSQLAETRLGSLTLGGVFAQQYAKGRSEELRPVSIPGGINLPEVISVCSPADPVGLLAQYKPTWIAIDCGGKREIPWLPSLLDAARSNGVPVVGWASHPFTDAVDNWLTRGGVLKWPRVRAGITDRIESVEQIETLLLSAQLSPFVLTGKGVTHLSQTFAAATEALLAARGYRAGRLADDAVAVGWRYLRAMESMPVPLDVYEQHVSSFWGGKRIAELRDNFSRFVDASSSLSRELHQALRHSADVLAEAHDALKRSESPLWLGLANVCVDSNIHRRLLFSTRARRDMFAACVQSRFNITEEDLKEVGIELAALKDSAERWSERPTASARKADGVADLLIGIPTRYVETHVEAFLQTGQLDVLLWPHQEPVLERRTREFASKCALSWSDLGRSVPTLRSSSGDGRTDLAKGVVFGGRHIVAAGALDPSLTPHVVNSINLWTRPDATEAIGALFALGSDGDHEDMSAAPELLDENEAPGEGEAAIELWIQEAMQLQLEGGRSVLMPLDESVNVIIKKQRGAAVEPRKVRWLRPGDELLFIVGQRRQSLYDLLISRVHRDPVIGQYLALVRRWQADFAHAFAAAIRQRDMTVDAFLRELQSRGSSIQSTEAIRLWIRGLVLAPNDVDDLRRVAEVLSLDFVANYYRQIHLAARRLKGLHISLSGRLNRWLASGQAGGLNEGDSVIDAGLGLTMDDFRHSLLRLRVLNATIQRGPFYRPQLGRLEGDRL